MRNKRFLFAASVVVCCLMMLVSCKYSGRPSYLEHISATASSQLVCISSGKTGKSGKSATIINFLEPGCCTIDYSFEDGSPFGLYVISVCYRSDGLSADSLPDGTVSICVTDESDYNRAYVYSEDNSVTSENISGWISTKRVVKLNANGGLSFSILCGSGDNKLSGELVIDNVQVRSVTDDNEYRLYQSDDGTVRMVFCRNDISDSTSSDKEINELVNIYSMFRNSIKWLSGDAEPFEDAHTDYVCTEYIDYFCLAGNPIYVNKSNVVGMLNRIETYAESPDNNIIWQLVHEMCHNFDGVVSHRINSDWIFDAEFSATFKSVCCLAMNGYGMGGNSFIGGNIVYHFANSPSLENGIYSDEGLVFKLLNAIGLPDNQDVYQSIRDTYSHLIRMSERETPAAAYDKFLLFVFSLSDNTGVDVLAEFSQTELETICSFLNQA